MEEVSIKKKVLSNVISILLKLLFILLIIVIIFCFLFGITKEKGLSMYPAIGDSNLILYYRLDHNYREKDVVVLDHNNKEFILRIVALEGQVVDINEEGELLVNNRVVEEDIFYNTEKKDNSNITFPYTVAKDEVFVLGDFRKGAIDSRDFGSVSTKSIKGKVINILKSRII